MSKCKKPKDPGQKLSIITESLKNLPPEEIAKYGIKEPYQIWEAPGCPACGGKGVKGRIAIYEVFAMTPELEQIVLEKVTESALEAALVKQGMITMKQDGIMKVLTGMCSLEEVLRTVEE